MHGLAKKAAATVLFYACTVTYISAQTAPASPISAAEAAKAVADTIDANTPKAQIGPLTFLSATSHDNIVDVQFAAKDATFFASEKAKLDDRRLALTRYYCSGHRVQFFNMGGVVRQITLAPDNRDRIEVIIDRAACANLANLPATKLADAESLARMAEAIATREHADNSKATARGPIQYDVASHDGVVEIHHIVTDPSVGQNIKAKSQHVIGVSTGYFCGKYGNELAQGLSIHEKFALADGSPVVDFTINRSSCGL
jgi:hypothetical protein